MSYADFLARKAATAKPAGIDVSDLHPSLFPHQVEAVRWAASTGRAATFLDTGLGKTRIQLAWLAAMTKRRGLILAPLSIARQTVREAAALDLEVTYARSGEGLGPGLYVTNYEMQHAFDPADFDAVVLDESSILKNFAGKMRQALVDRWRTPYRLACTATPAPNDHSELANHAEFLGAMSRVEMLSAFFVHDDEGWRLKGHAGPAMYRWMSTWAIAARRPSDLTGHDADDDRYRLPALRIHDESVETHAEPDDGQLFATELGGVGGRARARRASMEDRLARATEILSDARPSIAWCGLNDEADRIAKTLDAPNLHGGLDPDAKAELIEAFQDGEFPVLVTKPAIAGFGLNFQRATRQVFVGVGDSYETYYQAIRRSWRFGQTHPVDIHIVVSDLERQIVTNVRRKEALANDMAEQLVAALRTREEAA